jgi:hypothetical protein
MAIPREIKVICSSFPEGAKQIHRAKTIPLTDLLEDICQRRSLVLPFWPSPGKQSFNTSGHATPNKEQTSQEACQQED